MSETTRTRKADRTVPKYQLATIYQGLRRMHHIARKMTFCMSITDSKTYGADLMAAIRDALRDFVIAFDFQEERPKYYMKLVADVHWFTCIVDEVKDYNVLRQPQKEVVAASSGTRTEDFTTKGDKLIFAMYEEIGKTDEDISRWRSTALPADARH